MYIIDFSAAQADILSNISKQDNPPWAIPVLDFIRSWYDKNVQTFEVKTSGSTGAPKLIQHRREAMVASAKNTCDFFGLKKGDTALLAMPATFIGGKMMIVRAIERGLTLICTEPKSDPLCALAYDAPIEFAAFTPMQMSAILDNPLSKAKVLHINKVILGGGQVPFALTKRFQHLAISVYETYGMTETISHIALKKLNGADRSDYFTVMNGVKIAADDRGCLIIEAPLLSAARLVTNDIVNIVSDKQFQWLVRFDNIINTGGIKVYAEEIERKLQPYIDLHFFIAGIADDALGQKVAMVVETNKSAKDIQDRYAEALSIYPGKYEKPRQLLTIEKFSYTENGKINKAETLKRLS